MRLLRRLVCVLRGHHPDFWVKECVTCHRPVRIGKVGHSVPPSPM